MIPLRRDLSVNFSNKFVGNPILLTLYFGDYPTIHPLLLLPFNIVFSFVMLESKLNKPHPLADTCSYMIPMTTNEVRAMKLHNVYIANATTKFIYYIRDVMLSCHHYFYFNHKMLLIGKGCWLGSCIDDIDFIHKILLKRKLSDMVYKS